MAKFKFFGILIGGLLLLMTSCLGGNNDDNIDEWNMGNAQISSFLLSNDSITGLSSVLFTIDQLNGKIYNKDSMPYGTVIEEKVLCTLKFDNKYDVSKVLFIQPLTNDSVWGVADSIDFSAPVMITIYPHDGVSTKTYEAKVNIHQVNPDTMVWHKYSDLISGKTFRDMNVISYHDSYFMYVFENETPELYITDVSDMINWKGLPLSGFPADAELSQIVKFEDDLYVISKQGSLYHSEAGADPDEKQEWTIVEDTPEVKALLGFIPHNTVTGRDAVLSAIVVTDGLLHFATLIIGQDWVIGAEVPEIFPLSGFGSLNYESMYHPRLVIASGRDSKSNLSNKAWSTMDGLSWASLSDEKFSFSSREGASLVYYDNSFFLFGGIDASGNALNDIFYSKDYGVKWFDALYVMPEEYTPRGFSSVVIDKNNYILLFGGKVKENSNVLRELWRGRINRLGFGKE